MYWWHAPNSQKIKTTNSWREYWFPLVQCKFLLWNTSSCHSWRSHLIHCVWVLSNPGRDSLKCLSQHHLNFFWFLDQKLCLIEENRNTRFLQFKHQIHMAQLICPEFLSSPNTRPPNDNPTRQCMPAPQKLLNEHYKQLKVSRLSKNYPYPNLIEHPLDGNMCSLWSMKAPPCMPTQRSC